VTRAPDRRPAPPGDAALSPTPPGPTRARYRATVRSRTGRRLRGTFAAGAALALLAGCTADIVSGRGSTSRTGSAPGPSPSSGSGGRTSAAAHFGGCDHVDLGSPNLSSRFQVECASIKVPLDYAKPAGRQISIAVVRVHARGATPSGSLLTDPGGPGGSGVQFAVNIAAALPNELTDRFDLVGFDPRGVGSSSPIRCESDQLKDTLNAAQPDVRTAAGFEQAKQLAGQVAQACATKYGATLAEYDTVSTAKDMDRIRQALGDDQLTYLGFSYGTELGAQYAHLFPGKVRALVLDGAVNPLTDDITAFADQLDGFEKAFDEFAMWCKTQESCRPLANPRHVVYQLMAEARAHPLHSSEPGETRVATSSLVDLGVLQALYSQSLWPVLAQALLAAQQGDARGLLQLADAYNERDDNGHYSNISDANLAISCNDSKPGPSNPTIRATAASWAKRFPMFGVWAAISLFSCQQWQSDRTVPPKPTAPTSAHKILVVGNLHDPATPYQGAKDLARTLGNAVVLTWDGEGHTSYLEGSSCVDDAVNSYLLDLTLPPAGKLCPR
jgi:pimeloyl-ACP methyl ester carboxylesterase